MIKYDFDVLKAKTRRWIKQKLPSSLSTSIAETRHKNRDNPITGMMLNDTPPWSSPNVWNEITSYYEAIKRPRIFEYGTGNSTLWHFENLIKKGEGLYIGVEFDRDWFWAVIGALAIKATKFSENTRIVKRGFESPDNGDIIITVGNAEALIKLRALNDTYVRSLDQPCDVVIIDGATRKLCVNYVLSTNYLQSGGLMMLMEAGRGSPKWWEGKLSGEADYSLEVEKMISLGGVLLNGEGVDSWPGCVRKSPRPTSYYYPMEACRLIIPKD